MIADLHCHYAMHLLDRDEQPGLGHALHRRTASGNRFRAFVMWVANRAANYRTWTSGPRVTLDKLEQGDLKLVLSVLYVPLDEMDLTERYGAPPRACYFDDLIDQMTLVERELAARDPAGTRHAIVRDVDDLESRGRIAFVHCVEGGFHLGATPHEVDDHIAELARRGVAYITLAHLFWREVATSAPALPFLSDSWYDRIFPQPTDTGLTELGRVAVAAMYRHNVLVDLAHMSEQATTETLDLLDRLDPAREFPVLATHAGIRFPQSKQRYLLSEETVRRIADRDGVVGLILAQHQLCDGLRTRPTKRFEESLEIICRHIDRIEEVAGPGHVGLGSDLDGFIKPTMAGLESAADLAKLRDALILRYGEEEKVDGVLYGNARRVIARAFAARSGSMPQPAMQTHVKGQVP